MSKFSDKVKDFFYDATDYVIIIAILLVVVLIITWRLNALFAKNTPDVGGNQTVVEETQDDESQDGSDDSSTEDQGVEEAPAEEIVETITIEIPEGASSQTIANILFEGGIIQDKIEFLQTSRDLELDTQFRPGEYEFQTNMTLESIIRRVARQEVEAETEESQE